MVKTLLGLLAAFRVALAELVVVTASAVGVAAVWRPAGIWFVVVLAAAMKAVEWDLSDDDGPPRGAR